MPLPTSVLQVDNTSSRISESTLSYSLSQFSQDLAAHHVTASNEHGSLSPVSRLLPSPTGSESSSASQEDIQHGGSSHLRRILQPILGSPSLSGLGNAPPTIPNFPFSSPLARDALLGYAYHLYDSWTSASPSDSAHGHLRARPLPSSPSHTVYASELVLLLETLRMLHPNHAPMLLLLGCVYYTTGDLNASLDINREILSSHPTFVEAMCNLGTTLKALGRPVDAFRWWWKALQIRPTYWDVLDIMVDDILSRNPQVLSQTAQINTLAMDLCRFVLHRIAGPDGQLVGSVDPDQVHRLQKVLYTGATIRANMMPSDVAGEQMDYSRAIELAIGPSSTRAPVERSTLLDLTLSAYVAGLLLCTSRQVPFPHDIDVALSEDGSSFLALVQQPGFSILHSARKSGDKLLDIVGTTVPSVLLSPEQALRLPLIIWPSFTGTLPGIIHFSSSFEFDLPEESVRQQTHFMTSKIILALAKRLQESRGHSPLEILGFGKKLHASFSLILLLHYLALSLSPSPAAYNNIGILLSSTTATRNGTDIFGAEQLVTGQTLARSYYESGLHLDPCNPHLLTNMGSLFKDQGRIHEAIQCYMKAIHFKPDFSVALVNLANAIKDMGRPWDAITFYRQAIAANPTMPEAICGLAIALGSICDWRGCGGCGGEFAVDDDGSLIDPRPSGAPSHDGWLPRMMKACERQLSAAYSENEGIVRSMKKLDGWVDLIRVVKGRPLSDEECDRWEKCFSRFFFNLSRPEQNVNGAGFYIRLIEWRERRLKRKWYIELYGKRLQSANPIPDTPGNVPNVYRRLEIPTTMTVPQTPSVLPFHTFAHPMSARIIRLISHRYALHTSYTALTALWSSKYIHPPPPPPVEAKLNIGYVSSDFNDHPSAHLMQSVFGLHDSKHFNIYVYATSPSDGSSYRQKIERETQHFVDVSSYQTKHVVDRILSDNIHILINLNGYTKSARNEIFAARPCPVQMQLIGFASTLAAGWCDYIVCDPISCPRDLCATERWRSRVKSDQGASSSRDIFAETYLDMDLDAELDPDSTSEDWVFTEKLLYMPHTYMVTDHKQQYRNNQHLSSIIPPDNTPAYMWEAEEQRRARTRKSIFPDLAQDTIIFANFNQLYKIDPSVFAVWLRILKRVPNSILWLLRFPAAGEENLLRTAKAWAGEEFAAKIRFSHVAKKEDHILRAGAADLFLDTFECSAHTVAADVIWSGTPIITWPKYRHKMCSRVCASMLSATGFGDDMVVDSLQAYEERAVILANSVKHTEKATTSKGALINLRRNLYLNREVMPLFDTARWTRNIEQGYREAWRRWVEGTEFEGSDEWEGCTGPEKDSGCIWVKDEKPIVRDFTQEK